MTISLTLMVASTHLTAEDDASIQQARLDALQKAIAMATAQIESKTSDLSQIEQELATTELNISQLTQQKRALDKELIAIDLKIDQLEKRSNELQEKIESQKQHISRQLVEVYKRNNRSPIQLLLDSGSPADIDRQLVYLERINHARMALLSEFKALLEEQERLETAQLEQQQLLVAARDNLLTKESQLKAAQRKRQAQVAALNQSISSDQSKLQKLQTDSKALKALLEEMTAALDANESNWSGYQAPVNLGGSFQDAKGRLPWPIPSAKRAKERDGVALRAQMGTEVKAIYSGRIIFADWFRGQGLLIILDHGNNYWSLYGHNESLLKSAGDAVVAGETIATVGNSGGQNRNALYFEIRHKGQPQKPSLWCKS